MDSVMKGLMGAMPPLPQNFGARTAPASVLRSQPSVPSYFIRKITNVVSVVVHLLCCSHICLSVCLSVRCVAGLTLNPPGFYYSAAIAGRG